MKILAYIVALMIAIPVIAQEDEKESATPDVNAQQKIKAAHAAYITERIGLTPEEAEKFWPLYREYTGKRRDLRQQFRDAKREGKEGKALIDLDLTIKQHELDLEKDYSARMQQVISAQKLIQLREAEGEFKKLVLRQIGQRQQKIDRRKQLKERSQ